MALTLVELNLVSQAIARLGCKEDLTVANQMNKTEGIKANLFFAPLRDSLQRTYEWNFASDRMKLCDKWQAYTDLTTDQYVVSEDGDIYKCNLAHTTPAVFQADNIYYEDMLCVYEDDYVVDASTTFNFDLILDRPAFGYAYKFALPADFDRLKAKYVKSYQHRQIVEGGYLLTKDTSVRIEYVKKITDPTLWDSLFTEVFVLRLALKLNPAIGGVATPSLVAEITNELQDANRRARTVNSEENAETGNHSWNSARFTNGLVAGLLRVDARPQPL